MEAVGISDGQRWFTYHLRRVLLGLYNPAILRTSPLIQAFGLEQRTDSLSRLRRILTDGIETVNNNLNSSAESSNWRIYQILRRRYIEQVPQRKVAADLSLSVRQLQREEKLARELLADQLWSAHDLETKVQNLIRLDEQPDIPEFERDFRAPTAQEELERMEGAIPAQMVNIGSMVQTMLRTVNPLIVSKRKRINYSESEDLPDVWLKAPLLRQALLTLISATLYIDASEEIIIHGYAYPSVVCVQIQATLEQNRPIPTPEDFGMQLKMTEKLIMLCRGSLEIAFGDSVDRLFVVTITLPIAEQRTILVIDDNPDTRRLFEQYLSGSPYRCISTDDPQRGLAQAKELSPQAIILDLMMPDEDGWSLLWQFREHPQTRDIPIIICTVLPLDELGLVLGAAEFLHKPVTRPEFLAALNRQIDLP